MKPLLITVLILVAIAAATGTPKKYERRSMNHFGKVSITFSVFCTFSVSLLSVYFLNLILSSSAGELQKQTHELGNKLTVLLLVGDRNERHNSLDHFNDNFARIHSPHLPLSTD